MEIPVQHLNEKMAQVIADRERACRKQFSGAERSVLKSIGSVERAATNLREAVGRAWGTLSKAAEQHGARLSEQVLEVCKSLAAHRTGGSFEELNKFQEESVHAIRKIAGSYRKYIPSIIRRVKPEAARLEDAIAALTRSVTELGQVIDRSNLRELQLMASDADSLVQSAHELSLKTDEIQKANETIKELHYREAKLQDDLSLLGREQTLKELNQIERQIGLREAEILELLEPLLKPMRKMDRTDHKASDRSSKAIVGKMAESPLATVLETPASETRELLASVYSLLEYGELPLDQRRKQRAAKAIKVLQSGALDRFREDHSILQANRQEVLRQLKSSGVYDQWLSVRKEFDEVHEAINQHQSRMIELQSQEMRLRTSILAQKERMESTLGKLLGEHVSILV